MANIKKPVPEVKYYSSEPHAPKKKIADRSPIPSPVVGSNLPPIVDRKPARTSGVGPLPHSIKPRGTHGFGHTSLQKAGTVRLSGHPRAHFIGKR